MITPPIAGLMIDLLEPHSDVFHLAHLGYKSTFLLASVLLLAAVVLVRQIRVNSNKVPSQHRRQPHMMVLCTSSHHIASIY
jgi:hypothetical protein